MREGLGLSPSHIHALSAKRVNHAQRAKTLNRSSPRPAPFSGDNVSAFCRNDLTIGTSGVGWGVLRLVYSVQLCWVNRAGFRTCWAGSFTLERAPRRRRRLYINTCRASPCLKAACRPQCGRWKRL